MFNLTYFLLTLFFIKLVAHNLSSAGYLFCIVNNLAKG